MMNAPPPFPGGGFGPPRAPQMFSGLPPQMQMMLNQQSTPNPYSSDPNFHFWFHKFSWWYNNVYPKGNDSDTKVSRIAFSLAGYLIKDNLDSQSREILSRTKVKVLDWALDGEIASYFEALVGSVETVKPQEIPSHLIQQRLQANQVVLVVVGLNTPQQVEIMQALFVFIYEGGKVFFYNCAPHIIGGLFLGKIQPSPPSTVVRANVKSGSNLQADKDLLLPFKGKNEISLEYFRFPFEVLDKENVSILAKVQSQTTEPLLARFNQGYGTVYIMISKLIVNETFSKDPKQKIQPAEVEAYLKAKNSSEYTVVAWQSAIKAGWTSSINLAVASLPSLEMMSKILVKEKLSSESLGDTTSLPLPDPQHLIPHH